MKKQSYRLAKVMDFFSEPDSAACHILLKANNPQDAEEMAGLMNRADSLKRALRRGASFDDLAEHCSEDPGSKSKGGLRSLPTWTHGRPFEDFCFENKPGSIGAVKTSFGVHLIEVMEHTDAVEQVRIALIERAIEPSTSCTRLRYEVVRHSSNSRSIHAGRWRCRLCNQHGYRCCAKRKDRSGLRNAAELVSWAYNAEPGEVSNPILIDKNYVVGYLDRITEEGAPLFEYVENEMRTGAIKEAKGELYSDRMATGSLDEIASSVGGSVASATNVALKFPTINCGSSARA